MTQRKKSPKCAAIVTIRGPGKMTARGRRDIATWLRRQAVHLLKHGTEYTDGRFTARFFYN